MSENLFHSYGLNHSVDDVVLQRLAKAVRDAREATGKSQREFAELLGVAQSTIAGWEGAKNTPNLENLEKLARIRGQLPEEFVSYLYGRSKGGRMPLEEQIASLPGLELAALLEAIAARLRKP
jgi:transcriptional regulator with XRE-family HTH domain